MRWSWLAVVLIACGPSTAASTPPSTPTVPTSDPTPDPAASDAATAVQPPADPVRLESNLTVIQYDPELTIDPNKTSFEGTMVMHARLTRPTREIWLHGERLSYVSAQVGPIGGRPTTPLRIRDAGTGRISLTSVDELPAGDVTFTIRYTGLLDDTDTMGVFRQQDRNQWYAFTQFEAIAARRAFPCIDEPGVKVPWLVTLNVPKGMTAVSNAPVANEVETAAGRTFVFEVTPPLPSYLVAFGVGPFDIVDAGQTRSGKPIRIVTPAGRAAEAKIAVELTPKVLAWLEDWFGMPFPYAKIDAMAIPITVTFGAMENAGLITYRADILLMADTAPESRKRRYARYAAHELAHQWFGDLVTPAWWDDIWLNESFATWLPYKLMAEVFPTWSPAGARVAGRGDALGADSLGTARRIRQPIATEDDIVTAFDGITYGKGAAVLHMFEAWAGEAAFQRGVRDYLNAHAHGNATAHDFLAAVSASTGADITATMSTFLDQAGAPRLDARLTCDGDRAKIELTQSRYLPMGAARPATAPVWSLPVCVVYGAPGTRAGKRAARREVCALISTPTATIEGDGCTAGAWLYPNAGGRGYYRSAIVDGLAALERHGWRHLETGERLALAQDLMAAVAAGEADIATALALVPLLVADGNRTLVELAAGTIERVRRFLPANDPAIARWVRQQFGPIARRLGWTPRQGESLDALELRELIVPLVAELGADPTLIKQAVVLARDWRVISEGGVRGHLMRVAGRTRPVLIDQWRDDFVRETDRVAHLDLAVAIGRTDVRDELVASLGLLLDPVVDVREAAYILTAAIGDPLTQPWAQAWAVEHLDDLIRRFPRESAARLVGSLTASCDPDQVAPMRAIADAKIAPLSGGARSIDQAFEGLTQCIAQRHALEPSLEAWRDTLK